MVIGLAGLILLLTAVSGSSFLVWSLTSTSRRLSRLEARDRAGDTDIGRLLDQLDALQDQVTALRAETAELTERVDFSERLLAQSPAIAPSRPPNDAA